MTLLVALESINSLASFNFPVASLSNTKLDGTVFDVRDRFARSSVEIPLA